MKKIRRTFFLLVYYGLAFRLPNYSFPGGKIYNWLRIFCLRKVIKIGKNCRINERVRLDNVKIGNHVMIARESVILGKMHEFSNLDKPMEQQGAKNTKKTIIEDDVWFGLRVITMPGLKIRKGSIIAAGAVLTKDTEQYGIYGGVPAVKIKNRE